MIVSICQLFLDVKRLAGCLSEGFTLPNKISRSSSPPATSLVHLLASLAQITEIAGSRPPQTRHSLYVPSPMLMGLLRGHACSLSYFSVLAISP